MNKKDITEPTNEEKKRLGRNKYTSSGHNANVNRTQEETRRAAKIKQPTKENANG